MNRVPQYTQYICHGIRAPNNLLEKESTDRRHESWPKSSVGEDRQKGRAPTLKFERYFVSSGWPDSTAGLLVRSSIYLTRSGIAILHTPGKRSKPVEDGEVYCRSSRADYMPVALPYILYPASFFELVPTSL